MANNDAAICLCLKKVVANPAPMSPPQQCPEMPRIPVRLFGVRFDQIVVFTTVE
jgi:hypothetical protein